MNAELERIVRISAGNAETELTGMFVEAYRSTHSKNLEKVLEKVFNQRLRAYLAANTLLKAAQEERDNDPTPIKPT